MSNKSELTVSSQLLPQELLGKKYGQWEIISLAKYRKNLRTYVEAKCPHTIALVLLDNIKRGTHIGCLKCAQERNGYVVFATEFETYLYDKFKSIILRCKNPGTNGYERYKNIEIHSEWINNPRLFVEHMKSLANYKEGKTIDRIDNSLGYIPGNLQWATWREQASNRTTNVKVWWNNEELSFSIFVRKYTKLSYREAYYLYREQEWPLDKLVQSV